MFQRQGPQLDGSLFNFVHIGSSLGKQVLPSKVTAAGFVEISQRWRNKVAGGRVEHGERHRANVC